VTVVPLSRNAPANAVFTSPRKAVLDETGRSGNWRGTFAAYMRCSYWAIREACYTGDLPCASADKRFIIHIADLRAWFEKQKKDKIA
jgi:hypothetical protein